MNRLGSGLFVDFDEEEMVTVEMPAFVPATRKLTLKCISGDYPLGQEWVLDPAVEYIGYKDR